MTELELSIMTPIDSKGTNAISVLRKLLDDFEGKHHIQVRINTLSWVNGWAELVKSALYGHGPDVSEVGTTWMSGFIGMNALHPLSDKEIRAFGGPDVFLPQAWQSCFLTGDKQMWALPWLCGTRFLFYRRDLLADAGIDEINAFTDHNKLIQTLEKLKTHSNIPPWVVPTNTTNYSLLNIANWVWGSSGDFMTPDGKQLLFMNKEASIGMKEYFDLSRYLPQPSRDLDELKSADIFWQQGRAAISMLGYITYFAYRPTAAPEVVSNLGVALAPGVPFVGGSNLVVWKYTRHKNAALELLNFLSRPDIQIRVSECTGLLPVNMDALEDPRFSEGPLYPVAKKGLKTGRPLPMTLLWGLVEDRLTTAIGQIWSDILSVQKPNMDRIIKQRMEPIFNSLNFAIRSSTETQRRVRDLQLLQDVGSAAASGIRLEDTLISAVKALNTQLDNAPVAILLLDPESNRLIMKASTGFPLDNPGIYSLKMGEGITGWVAQNGTPLLIPDVRQDSRFVKLNETVSELCVPILSGKSVIGVLNVESPFPDAFSEDDQRLLSTLANNLSVLIERARLFEAVEAAQLELEERAEKLSRSNAELESFAYVASHDLQEPLRKILAFSSQLQLKHTHTVDIQSRDYIERIQNAASRMQAMINDLLALSRITTEAKPFILTDLNQIALEALSDLEIRIEKTQGKIEIDNLPTLDTDPIQMRQLLENLIGNALKFHREGIAPLIKIYSKELSNPDREGNSFQIFIEDNGIGFEEKYLDRIFQPFQRLHSRSEYEGCGMGLAICNKIIERHHGSITAKSKLDEGTTFIITLPS